MKELIKRIGERELIKYLKFRRIVILLDEYISYLILIFMIYNRFNFFIIILTCIFAYYTIYIRGYRKYWKLSNKYLFKEK